MHIKHKSGQLFILTMSNSIKPNQFMNLVLDIEREGIIQTLHHFDVLIKDFDEKLVSGEVANDLKVSYLSKANPPTWPVIGKLANIFFSFECFFK